MGTLSLVAPLVFFEKSRLWAGTGFHLLPSFHHHSTQHNYTTQTLTHTVTLTWLPPIRYTDTHPSHNVVCPSGAWIENRPHSMPSIRLAQNPKHVIVQWVGIRTHTHTYLKLYLKFEENCHKKHDSVYIMQQYILKTTFLWSATFNLLIIYFPIIEFSSFINVLLYFEIAELWLRFPFVYCKNILMLFRNLMRYAISYI